MQYRSADKDKAVAANESTRTAKYSNVDLEIRSPFDLKVLEAAVTGRLFVLHSGVVRDEFFLSMELPGAAGPDAAIEHLGRTLLSLPASARDVWAQARDRVFDIGLEALDGDEPYALSLAAQTIKTLVELGARVAFTIYPRSTE
jgi:hypothetical protein